MLKQKLDAEELALLEIVEDPVWFGEFMRSTADGEINKDVWPKGEPWKYRGYQREFLTDTSEFILYTGGRAIGKCQPSGSRVYTNEGYKTIAELGRKRYFVVYALDPKTMQLVQRRAVITKDKLSPAYTIRTESGHEIVATALHPILTPDGYKLMADIDAGDYVAVATKLPYESTNSALQWHELRMLGYMWLSGHYRAESKIVPRYKKIGAELEIIADRLVVTWSKDFDGNYTLTKKRGPYKHPINTLLEQAKQYHAFRQYGAKKIPDMIMHERLDNIQVFLEAVFAQFADLSARKITLKLQHKQLAWDFQELLLRFGIESKIYTQENDWILELLDYRAVYRFWKTFTLPGVSVGQMEPPAATEDATEFMRFDKITHKYMSHEKTDTYAVHVYDHNNYIGDNIYVHNSVVLEDKLIHAIVNSHEEFPITPEMVFVTANQAQMSMPQSRFISRFTASPFLKDFLKGRVNKSIGLMEFPRKHGGPLKFWMRIAGSNGEQNMVMR